MANVAEYTPNGREIRELENGKYSVQPHNDNYWIECDTLAEARIRYWQGSGELSARQVAESIVASWESEYSIQATVEQGVSGEDRETAAEWAQGDGALANEIVSLIETICRERIAAANSAE